MILFTFFPFIRGDSIIMTIATIGHEFGDYPEIRVVRLPSLIRTQSFNHTLDRVIDANEPFVGGTENPPEADTAAPDSSPCADDFTATGDD